MSNRKRKASNDNIFGLPNKVGRPRKARNPFNLSDNKYSLIKPRRGRPTKHHDIFGNPVTADEWRKKQRRARANRAQRTKPQNTVPKRQKQPMHPATQMAMLIVFMPATILVFLTQNLPDSVGGAICLGAIMVYPFVLMALHRQHRDETIEDVTAPLVPTDTYAPPAPALTGAEFEHEVAWLFNTLSKYEARVVGGAGDGGVDVEIYNEGKLVGVAQCKRYDPAKAMGPAPIRELYAVMHQKQVSVGYLFTTARITEQTEQEAGRLGVKLVYGARLMDMRHKARQKAGRAYYG